MDDRTYILDDEHRPVPVDLMTWARWSSMEPDKRRVAEDFTALYRVSTVFLGLDHGWGKGPPILFETMVFERQAEIREIWGRLMPVHEDIDQWRYASWDDALAGHNATVKRLKRLEAEAKAKAT